MENSRTAIGQPVLVGERMAYQIYSRVWQGQVRYSARVGRPYISKKTGEQDVFPEFEDYTADDFVEAARAAKQHVSQLRQAAYQHRMYQEKAALANTAQPDAEQPASPVPEEPFADRQNGVRRGSESV